MAIIIAIARMRKLKHKDMENAKSNRWEKVRLHSKMKLDFEGKDPLKRKKNNLLT